MISKESHLATIATDFGTVHTLFIASLVQSSNSANGIASVVKQWETKLLEKRPQGVELK